MLILLIRKCREPERPVASVRCVRDVTERPWNEVIVVVVAFVVGGWWVVWEGYVWGRGGVVDVVVCVCVCVRDLHV